MRNKVRTTEESYSSVFEANLNSSSDLRKFFSTHSIAQRSQFFRKTEVYNEIRTSILPILLPENNDQKMTLMIWSAGCSDGREAYSLAMVVDDYLKKSDLSERFAYQIIGSDINESQIRVAQKGYYQLTYREQKNLKEYQKYFIPIAPGIIEIEATLRKKVIFRVEDILNHFQANRYHLIYCSNLLVYYEASYRQEIASRLRCHLFQRGFIYIDTLGSKFLKEIDLHRWLPHGYVYHYFQR